MSKTADEVRAELIFTRMRLLTSLLRFDDARFHERPASGGWSAADVAEHLVRVETRIVDGARRTVAAGKGATRAPWDALLKLPLALGMIDGIRVRTVKGADPMADDAVKGMTRVQLLERLEATRAKTEAFLDETRDRDLRGLWLKHPFLGCFGVREFIAWVGWHEARHLRQLDRIARALGVQSAK